MPQNNHPALWFLKYTPCPVFLLLAADGFGGAASQIDLAFQAVCQNGVQQVKCLDDALVGNAVEDGLTIPVGVHHAALAQYFEMTGDRRMGELQGGSQEGLKVPQILRYARAHHYPLPEPDN